MPAHLAASLMVAFGVFWVFVSITVGVQPVEIRTPARLATAPVDYHITVVVEPNAANRLLILETRGEPGEYRRSDYQLEGEDAARIRQVWFRSLPAGCYWFVASVFDSSKRLAAASAGPVRVIGREGDPCPES